MHDRVLADDLSDPLRGSDMSELEPGQARIRHPELGEQVVPASAVPHWERGQWKFVEGDREEFPPEAQLFGGQEQVRIRHPVTGGESVVAASAVPYWREKDWLVVDEEAEPAVPSEGDGLEGLTVAELQDLARGAGATVSGTKAELVARLREKQEQAGDQPASTEEGEG